LGCQYHCHDSKRAFSTTGTKCTTCHKGTEPVAVMKQDVVFDHAKHATRGQNMTDCGECHTLRTDGMVDAPLARKDHQPCAKSGCHQPEFASRLPLSAARSPICGVCHDAAS